MRREILLALCYMFKHNDGLKDAFRTHGGFIWAISVMNGIGQSLRKESSEQAKGTIDENAEDADTDDTISNAKENDDNDMLEAPKEAFAFLKTLLHSLSIGLTGMRSVRRREKRLI